MTNYKNRCAELAQRLDDTLDFTISSETRKYLKALISTVRSELAEPESATLEQGVQQMQPFVVRHYTEDERPTIKGNGFDGLEIGEDREEAEAFVAWINEKLARLGQ
jgi:hypothetical protein